MFKSVVTAAKVTLVFLNIWVLAVVLVVSLGRWRVFESHDPSSRYDNSHLVVMRELKEEEQVKPGVAGNSSITYNLNPFHRGHLGHPVPAPFDPHQHPAIIPAEASLPSVDTRTTDTRVTNLQHWCKQQHPHQTPYSDIPKSKLTSILVDERHRFLLCQIPGVAINEWRKILLILSGVVNVTSIDAISGGDVYGKYAKHSKRLSDYSDKERDEMLKNYYKVIFVRDPLERLVIAYRTKMVSRASKYFHRAYGSNIIKKYRKNATETDIHEGTSVLFPEFVKFIIDNEHVGSEALNEHWEQYYKQCHPCLVGYNYVGLFENAENDIKFVLEKIKANGSIRPPYITDTKVLSRQELTRVYGQLNPNELNNLFKVYSSDYTLFGYQCPVFVHELLEKGRVFHDY